MTTEATSQSVLDRVQSFVSEHKQAIIIGASVAIAVGGVAYYASTSSSRGPSGDLEGGTGKPRKKKSKKRKTVKDTDGPILEEVSPKPKVEDDASLALDPVERAKILKEQGNVAYNAKRFAEAVEKYTQAIAISPTPESVYYSNRAACYMNFPKPEHEKAVADCTEALRIDPKYNRALMRRATALEKLGRLEESVRDWTALAMLTKFQDESASKNLDRTLKTLTESEAEKMFNEREPRLPPHSFVDAYFGAFRPRPRPSLPDEPSQGDKTLELALDALDARDYPHALSLINEALAQGISFPEGKSYALNLRGSFTFLWGDSTGAGKDLEEAIETFPPYTQNYVKIASVHMEQGKAAEAFNAFEEAIKHNADDPDIYYHRGQVMFIMSQFSQAAENYDKSLKLDSSFVFSYIQLAVAQYKAGSIASAMATFRRALKAFPQRSEPFNYYGELLLDQKRFDEAIEKFDKAIEIEKAKQPPVNVLAMVNKALAIFQASEDAAGAEKVLNEALQYDPDCEAAVATLAQILLSSGNVEGAAVLFRKQAELARTIPDIQNALQFAFATEAQASFMKNYPEDAVNFMRVPPS